MTLSSGPAQAAAARYVDDFNGDGYRDYASHIPHTGAGAVQITYGTATGPGTKVQIIDQASPGVPGANEWDDEFGAAMVGADFNKDGYADLAVGSPGEDVSGRSSQGAVTILWGSAAGLSGGTAIPNKHPQSSGQFGSALAAGDFNGDGSPDLAAINGQDTYVYRGPFTKSGTSGSVTRLTHAGLSPERLVAGKVTKDAATDLLVIGQVDGSSHTVPGAWFVRGGATFTSGTTLKPGYGEGPYGVTGVIADFNHDGYGDVALGDPNADSGKGAVYVWKGASTGPGSSVKITQATSGVSGSPEVNDWFGTRLSVGDVNHDSYPDLAVSVPGEDLDGKADAGMLHILRGGASGLTGAHSQAFAASTPGIPGAVEAGASFGSYLRLRDANRDGYADLFTDYLRFRGSASGISTSGVQSTSLGPDFME